MSASPGCGRYTVFLQRRAWPSGGAPGLLRQLDWDDLRWSRELNATASAFVSVPACTDLSVTPRCDELIIKRDGVTVFQGPVERNSVLQAKGDASILAYDKSWWWDQDGIKSDITGTELLSTHFLNVALSVESENYSGLLHGSYPYGALLNDNIDPVFREFIETDDPSTEELMRDLVASGISWTVVRDQLYLFSHHLFPVGTTQISLSPLDFTGRVSLENSGEVGKMCVVILSSYEVLEDPPEGSPEGTEPTKKTIDVRVTYPDPCQADNCLGVSKKVFDLPGLTETAALSAARERHGSLSGLRTFLSMEAGGDTDSPRGGYLVKNAEVDITNIVMGTITNLTAKFSVGNESETLRAASLQVEATKSRSGSQVETARLDLEPLVIA